MLGSLMLAVSGFQSGARTAVASPASLTVFAASDLAPPFKQIVPAYERASGNTVTLVVGSTGGLTHQIRNGAPADVFFAAHETYVQQLVSAGLTIPQTQTVYARGRIATVTLKSSVTPVNELNDLTRRGINRIAIANPSHAPYGVAAREALEAAGLWKTLQPKLVYAENVQQAAQFVRSGSVQAGIVARSVADTPDLAWRLVEQRLYEPLNQVAVVLVRTRHTAAATALIGFVSSRQGQTVMEQFGFLPPGESF